MDKKLIEDTLNKIINLDHQAENLKDKIEVDLKEKEIIFRKELRENETRYMEEIRINSRSKYKEILKKANHDKMKIIEESIEKSHDLEKLLMERKDELVRKVFLDLFNVKIG